MRVQVAGDDLQQGRLAGSVGPDQGHLRAVAHPEGVLAENASGLVRLAAAGWTEAWRAPRLVRGAPLAWQPDAIWGQFNHALG